MGRVSETVAFRGDRKGEAMGVVKGKVIALAHGGFGFTCVMRVELSE